MSLAKIRRQWQASRWPNPWRPQEEEQPGSPLGAVGVAVAFPACAVRLYPSRSPFFQNYPERY